mgnify:CR=1 FL=1
MPVVRTYGCPDCGGSFDFLHMTRDEPPPAHCELCRAFMGEVEPELPGVNIGGTPASGPPDSTFGGRYLAVGANERTASHIFSSGSSGRMARLLVVTPFAK